MTSQFYKEPPVTLPYIHLPLRGFLRYRNCKLGKTPLTLTTTTYNRYTTLFSSL